MLCILKELTLQKEFVKCCVNNVFGQNNKTQQKQNKIAKIKILDRTGN